MSAQGIRRRELLGGAAVIGAVGALGVARFAGGRRPDVIVYDGGHAASAAFGRSAAPRRIDLRREAAVHWRGLRSLKRGTAVSGLTNWDMYVAARGLLEEQGLRLVSEVVRRQAGLIAWSMA